MRSLRWIVPVLFPLVMQASTARAEEAPRQQRADEVVDQCLLDHRTSQELKLSRQLLQSQVKTHECAAMHCPGVLRIDCLRWLNELSEMIPSLTFQVTVDQQRQTRARIYIDEVEVEKKFAGKAVSVDPGEHSIRVEVTGFDAYTESIVVNEGEQYRNIVVAFSSPKVESASAPIPVDNQIPSTVGIPVATYVLGGLGALSIVNGVGWGIYSAHGKDSLESSCAPYCQPKSADVVRQRAIIADASIGVGIAALVGAGYFYWSNQRSSTLLPPVQVSILPTGGAMGTLRLVY